MDTNDLNMNVWGSLFGSPDQPMADPPVIGFRVCRVDWRDTGGPRLYGIGVGNAYKWLPGENVALCAHAKSIRDLDGNFISQGHQAPQEHCSCGLHACTDLVTLDNVTKTHGGLKGYSDRNHVLVGVIGTGEVLLFEKGWRAQFARVVAICDAFPGTLIKDSNGKVIKVMAKKVASADTLSELGRIYNANVVSLRDIETVVREHGGTY